MGLINQLSKITKKTKLVTDRELDNVIEDISSLNEAVMIYVHESVLGPADISQLASGYEFVPAPSVTGEYYDVDRIVFEFEVGTQPYSTTDTLQVIGTFETYINAASLLGGSGGGGVNKLVVIADSAQRPLVDNTPLSSVFTANFQIPLVLTTVDSTNPTGGTGILTIYTYYRIRVFGQK